MTLKEAKKILESEGFKLSGPGKPGVVSEYFAEYESPEICEAMQIVCSAGFQLAMLAGVFDERKERLKKEYEKNTKAPAPGEEQPKEGNPALAESASQFNDALLDEQAKKIAELTKENERLERVSKTTTDEFNKLYYRMITKSDKIEALGKEIAKLNGIIHDKNEVIADLGKELKAQKDLVDDISLKYDGAKYNLKLRMDECEKLKKKLEEKDAILSDVAEELRLTKIREKNLVEVSQKYMKENEELKKKLADKVVDKIDAQALKSAESALAYKEKVIAEKNEVIAEKNEVIADLTHELKAKHKKYVWYKGSYEAAQQILNTIADYAAKHPDKKISDQMVGCDNAEEGVDHSAKVVLCGKDVVKKFKENEESVFDFFKSRAKEVDEFMFIESGHLGGNGVFDQMEVVKPSQRFKSAVCDARLELLYFMSK